MCLLVSTSVARVTETLPTDHAIVGFKVTVYPVNVDLQLTTRYKAPETLLTLEFVPSWCE